MAGSYLLRKKSTAVFVICQSFAATALFAAGFQPDLTSPSLQGSAMAGAAAASNDVSALFNNPATLATLKQNQAYLGASEFLPQLKMSGASAVHIFNVPGDYMPSNLSAPVLGLTSQNKINQSAFLPSAYLGERISERFTFGLGINEPYYWSSNFSPNSVLRFSNIKTKIKSLNANPALSYKINDSWAVAAGFQAQYLQASFSNFYGPYTGERDIDDLLAASIPSFVKGNGWGYGYTLGALYQPSQSTRLGIGYRSKISTRLHGTGRQYTTGGAIVSAPSQDFIFNTFTRMSSKIKTPAVLTLGAAQDLNNQWTVKATAQVNFWDTFKTLAIATPEAYVVNNAMKMKWRNAWFASLGADYRATSTLTVRAGLAYDQTPATKAHRNTLIPDSNQFSANLGLTYALTNYLSVDGAYSHVFQNSRSVHQTESGIINPLITSPIEINQVQARFKGSANIVALGIRYSC
ncbi:Putative outer membrane protein precursor [Legionella massiliensis]|uniref:Putative outer membrane protein n=1 Tax=Legionella massiliensis TaxID=1034943 RepID=A0A078L0M7_9GAMM|nr:outer membrane protein transport protein [Legionella massiliensis]CDZ77604.1 Putative outer membrane protein precursor [Legionella massiliensis]CEE13342.1 Putative outer membrane protein precursor [Legionella massiliensis]